MAMLVATNTALKSRDSVRMEPVGRRAASQLLESGVTRSSESSGGSMVDELCVAQEPCHLQTPAGTPVGFKDAGKPSPDLLQDQRRGGFSGG